MLKFLKENIKLYVGVVLGITVGLVITIGIIYADNNNALTASSVNVDKTNGKLSNVQGDTLQATLEYLYELAENRGSGGINGTMQMEYTAPSGCTASVLNIGDYVSIEPSASSFTIAPSLTGYTSVQTINPKELTLWRVIKKNACNVEVVSEYVSSSSVYFRGIKGYRNYVGTLNLIASAYENPTFTVGSREIGYDGQTEFMTDVSAFDGSTNDAPSTTSTPNPTTVNDLPGEEYEGGVLGDTLYLSDYLAVQSVYQQDNNIASYCDSGLCAYKAGTTTKTMYWLGSRLFGYGKTSGFGFNGRSIVAGGGISNYGFRRFNSVWSVFSGNCSVRPILILKSGLAKSGTAGEDGTKEHPYTLVAS